MTTLQPRKPYTDAELRKLYPAGLELRQVQVLMRHGERTPISARFHNAGLRPFWPYCSVARRLRSTVLDFGAGSGSDKSRSGASTHAAALSTLDWTRRLETFGRQDEPVAATGARGELDDLCDMGSLTDVGRATTHELGRRLRSLYVDRLGFLPPAIRSADGLYLRSTPVPRALESLQQAFSALYPPSTRLPSASGDGGTTPFVPPPIVTRSPADETLYPNDVNCRRFAEISRAFAQRAADRWNDSDDMEYLNRLWGKWMPDASPRVAVDSHPRLSGIMDTINATDAHGPATRLPRDFYDPKARAIVEKIASEEWFGAFQESKEYRVLGAGPLVADVVGRMVFNAEAGASSARDSPRAVASAAPVRFGLSGCHDTTLAAVLASLGAFEDKHWPPFTSHLAFEMFKKSDISPTTAIADTLLPAQASSQPSLWSRILSAAGGKEAAAAPSIGRKFSTELSPSEKQRLEGYYVRIRYNDEPITVPGCRAPGNHLDGDESFCTLAAFKAIVDRFTPRDWKAACMVNLKTPAFPDKPEPAGYAEQPTTSGADEK